MNQKHKSRVKYKIYKSFLCHVLDIQRGKRKRMYLKETENPHYLHFCIVHINKSTITQFFTENN